MVALLGQPEQRVRITLDGRTVDAPAGAHLLEVARAAGVPIPTLCHHPDLPPMGACRLCLVEVTHPNWGGWSGMMAACLYPVREGLQVSSHSERVRRTRRTVLALLLARCPESPAIRALAAEHGVELGRLTPRAEPDTCILCGLCTRVCEAHATSAIATQNRGIKREVGTFFGEPPAACVGCGACAAICPTGHIPAERTAEGYRIWGRTFPTALCTVDPARCLGCGACEEVCPFHVARVVLTVDGRRRAVIPAEHCRGCGACLGQCPSAAVSQPSHSTASLFSRLAPEPGVAR